MNYEFIDCIDGGTEYCPCHLSESGDCILCSHLQGKDACDCVNWKGVCIYQEFIWNKSKAKNERRSYNCIIEDKKLIDDKLILFEISAKHKLVSDLSSPGSYIFLRNPSKNTYYNIPISIMEADEEKDLLKVAIEIKGIKTKALKELNIKDKIIIRGPYWNGVLGLKNLKSIKDSSVLIVTRGIGEAPMIPVMKALHSNGNKIHLIVDRANFEDLFIKEYLDKYNPEIYYSNTLDKGELSYEFLTLFHELLKSKNISYIHIAGPDILINRVLNEVNDEIKVSCCNNAKMCCGEGICGTCSVRYSGHKLKKMCKVQIDPKYIFKGRRYI